MAEWDEVQKRLLLIVDNQGLDKTIGAINQLVKGEKDAGRSVADLTKKYGTLNKAVRALVKTNHEAIGAMKSLVVPSTFGSTIRLINDYNKSLVSSSASVNRLGIGITDLEQRFTKITKTTSLTRLEIVNLFKEYEAGMRSISLNDFENIMKKIHSIVGANEKEISKYATAIGTISQEYPGLTKSLVDFAKNSKNLTKNEKDLIKTRIRNLFFIGKISQIQYKTLSAYISGNKQISSIDRINLQDKKDQIKALQEIKTHMQEVGLAVGQAIMPVLVGTSKILTTIIGKTDEWGISMAKIATIIATGMVAKGALMSVGGSIAGKFMGQGGGVEGVAGVVGKAAGTRVYVSNWAMIAGGRAASSAATTAAAAAAAAAAATGATGAKGAISLGAKITALIGSIALWQAAVIVGGTLAAKDLYTYKKSGGRKKGMVSRAGEGVGEWWFDKFARKEAEKRLSAPHPQEEKFQEIINKRKEDANKIKEEEEKLIMIEQRRKDIATSINSLYQAQSGYISTIVKSMSLSGRVDMKFYNTELQKGLDLIDAQVDANQKLLKNLNSKKGATKGELLAQEGISQEMINQLKSYDIAEDSILLLAQVEETRISANKEIADQLQKQVNLRRQGIELEAENLKYASLTAEKAGIMVQLADNYAIGVGASAKMRMRQYHAEEAQIKVLKRQREIAVANIRDGVDVVAYKNQVLSIDNQILQRQQAQAQQVKALRDGWISALSAMNSGFGGFMEIVMDSEKGLALIQKRPGAIRSELTGAIARRDASGRVLEDVGYNASERFTHRGGAGGIARLSSTRYGASRRGKWKEAWRGKVGPGTRAAEMLERGQTSEAIKQMRGRSQSIVGNNLTALGASNKIALAAAIEGRQTGGGNTTIFVDATGNGGLTRSQQRKKARDTGEEVEKKMLSEAFGLYGQGRW